jgi:hypothetical protein
MTALASPFLLPHRRRKRPLDDSHFHGPQRHRRRRLCLCPAAFPSPPIPPEAASSPAFDMGGFLSFLRGKPRHDDAGLGVYRGWVDVRSRDLSVATAMEDDDAGFGPRLVVRRRVGDPRKAALEAAAPRPRVKREPYYKEALERMRSHDKRLGELASLVNLEEEKLAELRKAAEPPKEVSISLRLPFLCFYVILFS